MPHTPHLGPSQRGGLPVGVIPTEMAAKRSPPHALRQWVLFFCWLSLRRQVNGSSIVIHCGSSNIIKLWLASVHDGLVNDTRSFLQQALNVQEYVVGKPTFVPHRLVLKGASQKAPKKERLDLNAAAEGTARQKVLATSAFRKKPRRPKPSRRPRVHSHAPVSPPSPASNATDSSDERGSGTCSGDAPLPSPDPSDIIAPPLDRHAHSAPPLDARSPAVACSPTGRCDPPPSRARGDGDVPGPASAPAWQTPDTEPPAPPSRQFCSAGDGPGASGADSPDAEGGASSSLRSHGYRTPAEGAEPRPIVCTDWDPVAEDKPPGLALAARPPAGPPATAAPAATPKHPQRGLAARQFAERASAALPIDPRIWERPTRLEHLPSSRQKGKDPASAGGRRSRRPTFPSPSVADNTQAPPQPPRHGLAAARGHPSLDSPRVTPTVPPDGHPPPPLAPPPFPRRRAPTAEQPPSGTHPDIIAPPLDSHEHSALPLDARSLAVACSPTGRRDPPPSRARGDGDVPGLALAPAWQTPDTEPPAPPSRQFCGLPTVHDPYSPSTAPTTAAHRPPVAHGGYVSAPDGCTSAPTQERTPWHFGAQVPPCGKADTPQAAAPLMVHQPYTWHQCSILPPSASSEGKS